MRTSLAGELFLTGNRYRLVARVNYKTKRLFILRILTHAEYSKGGWKE